MDGQLYESVGIECGTLENGQEVIGLLFPLPCSIDTENQDCDVKYMTLPAAKSLLIDLKDAIETCIKHAGR